MGKPSFSGGSTGPDTMAFGNLTYTNLNHEDSLYGANGYDPSRAFKSLDNIFGGGGGDNRPSYSYGSGGGLSPMGGGMGSQLGGMINRGRVSGGVGGSIPVISPQAAAQARSFREMAPYMAEQQLAQQQIAGQMGIAEMQARAQLAAQLLQAQLAREERMMMLQDNERNRMAQLEQQRRGALADQHQQRNQYYYQYGI